MILRTGNTLMIAAFAVLLNSCGSDESKTGSTSTSTSSNNTEVPQEESVDAEITFTGLLMELETYTGWNAVNSSWKERRDSWLAECQAATDVTSKANLLMEFESVVEWAAVDPKWADVRDAWSLDCAEATSEGELANLLVIFESYILWDAVSAEWAARRDSWIKDCEGLESGSGW